MTVDLDKLILDSMGWELSVQINGSSYATRPMPQAMAEQIKALEDGSPAEQVAAKLREVAASFLCEPPPDLDSWSPSAIIALIAACTEYSRQLKSQRHMRPSLAKFIRNAVQDMHLNRARAESKTEPSPEAEAPEANPAENVAGVA